MSNEQTTSTGTGPVPRHLRPTTLHVMVLALWIVVGVFTGLGLASAIGTVNLYDGDGLSLTEHFAVAGQHAGPWFATAAIALGAVAVVEAILLTLGHVEHLEIELEPPTGDA